MPETTGDSTNGISSRPRIGPIHQPVSLLNSTANGTPNTAQTKVDAKEVSRESHSDCNASGLLNSSGNCVQGAFTTSAISGPASRKSAIPAGTQSHRGTVDGTN